MSEAAPKWLASPPSVGADGAFLGCPCDSTDVYASLRLHNNLSTSYGRLCSDWDGQSGVSASLQNGTATLPLKWCFVDAQRCNYSNYQSSMFTGARYSYTTCGSAKAEQLSSTLHSKLRIGYMGWGNGASLVQPANLGIQKSAFMEFAYHVLKEMGLEPETIQYRALSNISWQSQKHWASACVYDMALGNVDMCLGPMWALPERLNLFSHVTVFSEPMTLYVRKPSEDVPFWEHVMRPLTPFTEGLWGVICGTILFAACVHAIIEHGHDGGFQHEWRATSFLEAIYFSLLSLLSGGLAKEPVTVGGRILSLGFAFFILIVTASFTANTATILIQKSVKADVQSIDDALQLGHRICYHSLFQGMWEKRLGNLGVKKGSGSLVFAGLDQGDCKAAINSAALGPTMCRYKSVGKSLGSVPTGFYTDPRLARHVSMSVSIKSLDGTWARLEKLFMEPHCVVDDEDGQDSLEKSRLKPQHMLGAVVCLVLACVVALVHRFCVFVEQEGEKLIEHVGGCPHCHLHAEHLKSHDPVEDNTDQANHPSLLPCIEVNLDATRLGASTERCSSEIVGQRTTACKDISGNIQQQPASHCTDTNQHFEDDRPIGMHQLASDIQAIKTHMEHLSSLLGDRADKQRMHQHLYL